MKKHDDHSFWEPTIIHDDEWDLQDRLAFLKMIVESDLEDEAYGNERDSIPSGSKN